MPTKQTESAPSFLQVYTQMRRDRMKHSFLRQISACVDWRGIRTLLNKKYTKTQNATGNPAYDALMMFKILLEDLRTEEEPAQEQAYQYELKSRKPGVDTEARWVRKGRHYRYGYKKHVLTEGLSERIHRISWKLWHKSEAYAWASCAPEQQIARKSSLSGG